VTGAAVLQWRTGPDGALDVLLRRVVEDHVDATVKYQYPADDAGGIVFPVPTGPMSGVVGVEAPVALELAVASVDRGRVLDPRDVPPSVLELTPDPLSVVVAFDEVPRIAIRATARPPVGSSTTQIDDLQALTVIGDDGREEGKLRLTVRNTSKQVLLVDLPDGAHLTHCFRDGLPLRPAADPDRPERTIVPLLRSEQAVQVDHVVDSGETLSAIALATLGSPSRWTDIAAANPEVDPGALRVGQHLVIPSTDANAERSFVLELAWERQARALGSIGRRAVALPTLDLPVLSADWHVYLPDEVEPIALSTALDRRDAPSLVGRVVEWLAPAAWAGDGYASALTTRRSKWEAKQEQEVLGVDPFPLVGRKLAFSGRLLGTEAPRLVVTYVAGATADGVRLALGAAAVLAAWALTARPRDWRAWGGAVAVAVVGGWLGISLLGTWRHLAWGVDLGLLAGLWGRGARSALLLEVGAVALLLVAACGGPSSSVGAALLLPVLALAHRRVR
jgi:LysM repeat protein